MRTFTSLEIRFEYVLVGKLPNRRIIRRKIRSCDSGISGEIKAATERTEIPGHWFSCNNAMKEMGGHKGLAVNNMIPSKNG